uniref:Uncharacterized protein n=1 Tax=Cajanus cajan TaxID=3821 RepID=A0A151SMK5_CAJCA|nr:hypothetical protein KK1_002288 [Cajanus cajan]
MERPTTLLKRVKGRGDIHEIKVCKGTPLLTHLLFDDECFIFCKVIGKKDRHYS